MNHTPPPTALSSTGVTTKWLLGVSALLMLGGIGLVVFARRHRPHHIGN